MQGGHPVRHPEGIPEFAARSDRNVAALGLASEVRAFKPMRFLPTLGGQYPLNGIAGPQLGLGWCSTLLKSLCKLSVLSNYLSQSSKVSTKEGSNLGTARSKYDPGGRDAHTMEVVLK